MPLGPTFSAYLPYLFTRKHGQLYFLQWKKHWVQDGTGFVCVPLLAHQKIFDNFGTIPKCSDAVDVQDNCLDTVVHKGIFMLRFLKSGICSIQVLDTR